MDSTLPSDAKIRWQCRRGMLELDILLNAFLEQVYPSLSTEQKQHFVELLSYSDMQLHSWLTARTNPADQNICTIVQRIRACKP